MGAPRGGIALDFTRKKTAKEILKIDWNHPVWKPKTDARPTDGRTVAVMVEHALPGRMDELPDFTEPDIAAIAVVAIGIDDASAKIRSGGTGETDVAPGAAEWADIVPLATVPLPPIPEPDLAPNVILPASVESLRSAWRYRAAAL